MASYILRTDTDDIMSVERIDKQLTYAIENSLDICSMNMSDKNGNILRYPSSTIYLFANILLGMNPIAHPTICFDRQFFNTYCFYNPSLKRWKTLNCDTTLFYPDLKFGHLNAVACQYDLEPSYSKDIENARAQVKIRYRYLKTLFLLFISLAIGLLPNIFRILLPSKFLLRWRRRL